MKSGVGWGEALIFLHSIWSYTEHITFFSPNDFMSKKKVYASSLQNSRKLLIAAPHHKGTPQTMGVMTGGGI